MAAIWLADYLAIDGFDLADLVSVGANTGEGYGAGLREPFQRGASAWCRVSSASS